MGIEKMGIHLVEAAKDGEKTQTAFKDLGLSASELLKYTPDQQFAKLADAIKSLPSPAEKAAAAVEIFGHSGGELINVLNKGSAGFEQAKEEAEKFGLTFDKLTTYHLAEGKKAFKDATDQIEGMKVSLATKLAPALEVAATVWKNFLKNLRGGNVFFTLSDSLDELKNKKIDGAPLKAAAAAKPKPKDEITSLADELGKSAEKDQEARNRLMGQDLSPLEQYKKKVDEIVEAMKRLHNAHLLNKVDDQVFARDKAGLQGALQRVGADEAKRRQDIIAKQGDKFKALQDSLKTPAETLKEELAKISEAQRGGFLDKDHAELGQLKAHRNFLEQMPDESNRGQTFPPALLQGTAEAFHAALERNPIDKKTAEILKVNQKMNDAMQRIANNLVPKNQIGH